MVIQFQNYTDKIENDIIDVEEYEVVDTTSATNTLALVMCSGIIGFAFAIIVCVLIL